VVATQWRRCCLAYISTLDMLVSAVAMMTLFPWVVVLMQRVGALAATSHYRKSPCRK
jgi:hypothetical protein